MTVVNAIPELWAAGIERALEQETLFGRLTRDVSSQLPEGDTLHLNQITSAVTISDNTRNTDIPEAQTPTTDDTSLVIDKRKVFNIAVDDVDEAQTRASIMSEYARMAAEGLATTFDADVYSTYNSNWVESGAGQNAFEAALKPSAIVDADKRTALVNEIRAFQLRANRANWPTAGRWAVFSPEVFDLFMQYLTVDKANLGSGSLVDEAMTDGSRGRLFGFTVYVYNGITATEAENVPMALFGTNRWGVYARQINSVEAYRPDRRFSDNLKGLLVYGVKEVHAESKLALVQPA